MGKKMQEKMKEIVDDYKECYESSLSKDDKSKKQKICAKNLSDGIRSVIDETTKK